MNCCETDEERVAKHVLCWVGNSAKIGLANGGGGANAANHSDYEFANWELRIAMDFEKWHVGCNLKLFDVGFDCRIAALCVSDRHPRLHDAYHCNTPGYISYNLCRKCMR